MMTIVAAVFERPWQLPMPGMTTWLAMIGLSALSTALAYIVFFQVLRRSGSTNVMLVTLLIPVTAILLGYLVLGESISLREIIGALVIGSALLLMDGRVLKLIPGFSIPKTTPKTGRCRDSPRAMPRMPHRHQPPAPQRPGRWNAAAYRSPGLGSARSGLRR